MENLSLNISSLMSTSVCYIEYNTKFFIVSRVIFPIYLYSLSFHTYNLTDKLIQFIVQCLGFYLLYFIWWLFSMFFQIIVSMFLYHPLAYPFLLLYASLLFPVYLKIDRIVEFFMCFADKYNLFGFWGFCS